MTFSKNVCVTGGAGFIGTHLAARLRKDGAHVTVIDRKYPEFGWSPANRYEIFDLRNDHSLYHNFNWSEFDEIYQLAAEMGGAGYVFTGEHDAEIIQSSARINLNVLEACRVAGVKKLFFASSACVYPSIESGACREEDAYPANPDSDYGFEKLFAERAYAAYARNYGMTVRIGRFHNIFGAFGTWRGGREKAPAALCRKVALMPQGGTVEVWGHGHQRRSFLHVDEAVEGVVRLMAAQGDVPPVNIGSSESISINDLAHLIGDVADKAITVHNVDGPIGVDGRNSDNNLMWRVTGWAPSDTLREGIEKTYPWVREQAERGYVGT